MVKAHILGASRIGANRQLKTFLESYWRGDIDSQKLQQGIESIQQYNWETQAKAGLDFINVDTFYSGYDHVLDTAFLLDVIPDRFRKLQKTVDLNTVYCMARGQAPNGMETTPCEMTKWFNTNYHYIVPEFTAQQKFNLRADFLLQAALRAQNLQTPVKPVLLGPLTFLWLGKTKQADFDKLNLLDQLIPAYQQLLAELQKKAIQWVQIDEPILGLDLPLQWRQAFAEVYKKLNWNGLNCLLTTYFTGVQKNIKTIIELPVHGLHLDLTVHDAALDAVLTELPQNRVLSLGIINGRNVWKSDINQCLQTTEKVQAIYGNNLWLGSSCSLLHVPVDLDSENHLDPEIKQWLAFGKQKIDEIALLKNILNQGRNRYVADIEQNQAALLARRQSKRIHQEQIQERVRRLTPESATRKSIYPIRAQLQRAVLKLADFPTTTIGSFPQTKEIRQTRHAFQTKKIDKTTYEQAIKGHIAAVIKKQEQMGLDVLVHGEPERNDMVEYFGELLDGFAFTEHGWLQSYGSRCVKPPIIFGDVSRPQPMTVSWIQYAQSLSTRPVKGMLTGPVTILAWSFVRDDKPLSETALQIALVIRDEVQDLEKAGIKVIQIDEPAFRESLPLCKNEWQNYLDWAVFCFRVASSGVKDETQIHTHMCYSEFNDIIQAIASLDADVITIESYRSDFELLSAFEKFSYPNEIGPGVYDIHSPRVPSAEEIFERLKRILQYIPANRLWVNPDCGLKTRGWPEVELALAHMVQAAERLRLHVSGSVNV